MTGREKMRKQEKIIIWPVYFDANKTRKEGRRVSKNEAVQSPKIAEIETAATQLRLEPELISEKSYPRSPWNKAGMLLVEKQGSKEKVINQIIKQIIKNRGEGSKN